ncbi:aspartate/glutamate racemase family protein [Nitratireductor sp. ZSWI3]|uniref:aspartate/glutamate racemase family protein n=1 Tax=Nitratireductor sp. ZSWI3 TaxID=2966359 RepID=UPI00214F6E27|nr:aspartate/glutamate racemase family protein [Nitratireductor sp. ZSWI3]MCR4267593.1 aspartate/glutamate racemase family protein [Nitratireductor sp. ZSWI3]
MTVLLVNPNTNGSTTAAMVEIALSAGTGLDFAGRTAPFGAPMITEPEALAVGARAVSALLEDACARREPWEGVIIAAFGDPGLDEARQRLPVPVCGIGEASFHEAAAGGRRFAVATTTPALEDAIAARVARAGLAAQFAGTVFTDADPVRAVAVEARLIALLRAAVERAARSGADAVIIGGGPLARAAVQLRGVCAIPIIEPVPAAARRIRSMIDEHASGAPLPR